MDERERERFQLRVREFYQSSESTSEKVNNWLIIIPKRGFHKTQKSVQLPSSR